MSRGAGSGAFSDAGKIWDDEGSLGNGIVVGGRFDWRLFGGMSAEGAAEVLTHERSGFFQAEGESVIFKRIHTAALRRNGMAAFTCSAASPSFVIRAPYNSPTPISVPLEQQAAAVGRPLELARSAESSTHQDTECHDRTTAEPTPTAP